MNKELIETIAKYSLKHNEYSKYISEKSKENVIGILTDLITICINDKNSSILREFITAHVAGYMSNEEKLGYNGYKMNNGVQSNFIEIKPKNIYFNTSLNKWNRKLNGAGNFTDFTWRRFNEIKKDNIKMLISGFCKGQLLYILEFDFNEKTFVSKMQEQLKKRFPKGDKKGQYLRSANFSLKHYIKSNSLKIVFKNEKILSFKDRLTKDLFYLLTNK